MNSKQKSRLDELMKQIEPLSWKEVDEFNSLQKLKLDKKENQGNERKGHLVNGKLVYDWTGDEDDENLEDIYNGPIKVGESYNT